ncbi:hypothetical protein [Planomonospora sp. ID82291]|uniref:hypothetical protein n=1 Tax=Planomonospora sp. ID82291 TaxID=2738136 RepID=UPI0018C386D6|nr:hypothetical protein [Planomonospora sp. ID82291]MBG0818404.1 hypothetical protein [Planomonospora sp. ID82291]
MTRDRARKQAIRRRSRASGEPYAAARRHLQRAATPAAREIVRARDLHTDLAAAFRMDGWPVEMEAAVEFGEYLSYFGPLCVVISRNDQRVSWSGDEDPDDAALDLTRPPMVFMAAPSEPFARIVEFTLPGDLPAAELVAQARQLLAAGRSAALAAVCDDSTCSICGEAYPRAHLLTPSRAVEMLLCPLCIFDGDVFDADLVHLATQINELEFADLAVPAGWSAMGALLACAAGDGLVERMHATAQRGGVAFLAYERWSDPGAAWIWLPAAEQRPAALRHLGPGARLDVLVDAVDAAYPHLRQRVRTTQNDSWQELIGAEKGPAVGPEPDRFIASLWPVIIGIVVAFTAQALERPTRQAPLAQDRGALDALRRYWPQIASPYEVEDAMAMVEIGLDIVAETLFGTPQ